MEQNVRCFIEDMKDALDRCVNLTLREDEMEGLIKSFDTMEAEVERREAYIDRLEFPIIVLEAE